MSGVSPADVSISPRSPGSVASSVTRGMKFSFADSLDVVDPSFDFTTERRSPDRVRQRHGLYPHEIFSEPPYDGVLVSKAIVEGTGRAASGKYSLAQRHRLLRVGVREFFRLDDRPRPEPLLTMGDCGAFTYVREEQPLFTVDEVIDFYECCGFDYGVAVDHVILSYRSGAAPLLPGMEAADPQEQTDRRRQQITLEMAEQFLDACGRRGSPFVPVGVAQGWSPDSYRYAVERLQQIGYDHLTVGGLVPLKTPEIIEVLATVHPVLRPGVKLHLFGVTRVNHVATFARYGVTSFDSTSPLRQAFKDDKDNYYTPTGTYTAIRVPQVDGNTDLKDRIRDGKVVQAAAVRLERACLDALARYDRGAADVGEVVDLLRDYERVHDEGADRSAVYRQILLDKPWKQCPCEICRALGIHVMLFRGAERNRRRGFHNLFVFERRLRGGLLLESAPIEDPSEPDPADGHKTKKQADGQPEPKPRAPKPSKARAQSKKMAAGLSKTPL